MTTHNYCQYDWDLLLEYGPELTLALTSHN